MTAQTCETRYSFKDSTPETSGSTIQPVDKRLIDPLLNNLKTSEISDQTKLPIRYTTLTYTKNKQSSFEKFTFVL